MITTILQITIIILVIVILFLIFYIFINWYKIITKYIELKETIKNNKLTEYYKSKSLIDEEKSKFKSSNYVKNKSNPSKSVINRHT